MFTETSYGKIPNNELILAKIPDNPTIALPNYLDKLYDDIDKETTYLDLLDEDYSKLGKLKNKKVSNDLYFETAYLKVRGSAHRIKLIKSINPKIAYLLGYFYGDGGLKDVKRSKKNSGKYDHKLIVGDEFKIQIEKRIMPLFLEIFNLKSTLRLERIEKGERLYYINPTCKVIYRIFTKIFELNEGPKKDIKIPKIIQDSGPSIRKWFVRGFFDADGDTRASELYVNRKPSSPRIKVRIKERKFIEQLKIILDKDFGLGFTGPYTDDGNQWYIQTGKKDLLKAYNEKLFIHPIKSWRLKKYLQLMEP
ncbi:MAG: hypothetical protein CMH62_01765 [Nanoarchaeota archaeon]|nr:hypothetical protein [Nanoarchaeota archaeon]|tara:strand:- start:525 stop:1448 length:924 start_codon:yes stop_codon:yes gene_type:complete